MQHEFKSQTALTQASKSSETKSNAILNYGLLSMRSSAVALVFAFFLALTHGSTAAEVPPPKRPLIFVPGIIGSKLCEFEVDGIHRTFRRSLWGGDLLDLDSLDRLILDPIAPVSKLIVQPCGLLEEFAVIPDLFTVGIYDKLIDQLKVAGYVPGESLFIFDYDWRKSNLQLAHELEAQIKAWRKVLKLNAGDKLDILAHSMGGVLTRVYLHNYPKVHGIERVVFMATPHKGSSQVFKTGDSGWDLFTRLIAGGSAAIRRSMFTWPSVYEIIPLETCCVKIQRGSSKPLALDMSRMESWQALSWFPDNLREKKRLSAIVGSSLTRAMQVAAILGSEQCRPDVPAKPASNNNAARNVKSKAETRPSCLYVGSNMHETTSRIVFDEQGAVEDIEVSNEGDEAVLVQSASNGHYPKNPPPSPPFQPSKNTHAEIFLDEQAWNETLKHFEVDRKITAVSEGNVRATSARIEKNCDAPLRRATATGQSTAPFKPTNYVLQAQGGMFACIASVRLLAGDEPIRAGQRFSIELKMTGQRGLQFFPEMPVLRWARDSGAPVLVLEDPDRAAQDNNGEIAVTYKFSGRAPSAGFYRVTAHATGLPDGAASLVVAVFD